MRSAYRHPTEEDINKMVEMKNSGSKTKEIADTLGYSARQVREALKRRRRSQTKVWTQEEIQILKDKYRQGFITVKQLKPFLPYKADFSIRNKIKSLKKKGLLNEDTTFIPINLEETESVTITQEPIVTDMIFNIPFLLIDEFPFMNYNNNEGINFDDQEQFIDFSGTSTENIE